MLFTRSQPLTPLTFGGASEAGDEAPLTPSCAPTGTLLIAAPSLAPQGTGGTGLPLPSLAKWVAPAALVSFFCATGLATEPRPSGVQSRTAAPLNVVRLEEDAGHHVEAPGEKCVAIKTSFGLTLTELAEALKTSRATLYAWLDGAAKLHDANAERLDALRRLAIYWEAFVGAPLRRHDPLRGRLIEALAAEQLVPTPVYAIAADARRVQASAERTATRGRPAQSDHALTALDDFVL